MTKAIRRFLSLVLCACALSVLGCKPKQQAAVDASQPLEESFQAAEPAAQQAIATASASLKVGNYAEAEIGRAHV